MLIYSVNALLELMMFYCRSLITLISASFPGALESTSLLKSQGEQVKNIGEQNRNSSKKKGVRYGILSMKKNIIYETD